MVFGKALEEDEEEDADKQPTTAELARQQRKSKKAKETAQKRAQVNHDNRADDMRGPPTSPSPGEFPPLLTDNLFR